MNREELWKARDVGIAIGHLEDWIADFAYRLAVYEGTETENQNLAHAQLMCLFCNDELWGIPTPAQYARYKLKELIAGRTR